MEKQKQLLQTLEDRLAQQLTWRRVMSGAYFVSSAVAIVCAGAATVVSGGGYSTVGAVLAGATTIVLGLEKAMLFREKWSHHLLTYGQLEALRLEYLHAGLTEAETAKRLGSIITQYGANLPVAPREHTQGSQ
jgi:hypothetical protein